MMEIIQQNSLVLSFLYDFNILQDKMFKAEVDFIVNGKRKIGEADVEVKFGDADNICTVSINNPGWSKAQLPLTLNSSKHTFSYISNIALQVSGVDPNPLIGKFRVSVFPKTENF